MCDELEKYVKQPTFNPIEIQKVSLGASILCEWVLSLVSDRIDLGHNKMGTHRSTGRNNLAQNLSPRGGSPVGEDKYHRNMPFANTFSVMDRIMR